jgi:anti-sigma factor RsiW
VPRRTGVTPDVLRDYLEGRLSDLERERVELAIRDDQEITRAFQMIREGTDVLRARLELNEEIPAEWLSIISRWDLPQKG